jgi:hypothetical protein
MTTIKNQLIQEIEGINDDNLLKEIFILIRDVNGLKKYVQLSPEQKKQIEQARQEFLQSKHTTTEQLFNGLGDD